MKAILALIILTIMGATCFAGLDTDIAATKRVILPSGNWTPTPTEITNALVAIQTYLDQPDKLDDYSKAYAKMILDHAKEYRVQFIGTVKNGQKVIWCNFFPAPNGDRERFPEWKESKVEVEDGGFQFWHIDYNPGTDKCLDFEANGVG